MELGHAVDRFRLNRGRNCRVFVLEFVDGAMRRIGETPGAAEVDDAQATVESFWNPLAGLLVRRSEKENFDAALFEQIPGEGNLFERAGAVVVAELGMNLDQRHAAARCVFGFDAAGKDWGRSFEARMAQQEASQFGACIPGYADDCGLNCLFHDSNIALRRDSTSAALRWSGQMTSTVSSPA